MNASDSPLPETPAGGAEMMSALFAQHVMQQSNMALMALGKLANPATGEIKRDLETAQFFIAQLEMLEVKTRGNLSKEEAALLKQSLMSLRMAFVEAVEKPEAAAPSAAKPEAATENKAAAPKEADAAAGKKFSKKY